VSDQPEAYVRWEPIPSLPEHPIGAIRFSYDGEQLTVTAAYGFGSEQILTLRFSPRAFKAYEELSDPWMEHQPPQPMVNNPSLSAWTWPLQEVRNSRWLERVISRTGGIDDIEWKHFVIATGDLCLHVMAVEPEGVELV
jgi:hypothetical protein